MRRALWWIGGSAALLACGLVPFFLSVFAMSILRTALILAIFVISLDLILGHGGLISLGHATFLGIGGYTVGLLVAHGFNNFVVCVLAGTAASIVTALLIGPVVLRTREAYFLMVTLAIGQVLRNLAISWRSMTHGDDGLSGINLGVVAGIDLGNGRNFYFLVLGSLLVVLGLMAMLTRAPLGHALRALRDNRSRMSVLGVYPLAVQVTAFTISAGIAGFAGTLYAYEKAFVSPNIFSVEMSAQALLMLVVGGARTLIGPVAGTLVVEFIRGIGSVYTDRWQTVLGLLAVIVAITSRHLVIGRLLLLLRPQFWTGDLAAKYAGPQPIIAAAGTDKGKLAAAPVFSQPAPAIVKQGPVPHENGALLTADNIVKNFRGLSVLDGISLSVAPGERRGLIGPNGAGKTTFLNILSSIELPTSGRVHYAGQDITALPPHRRARLGIGRTFQISNLFNNCTVRENLALGLVAREGYELRVVQPLERYADVQGETMAALEKWNLREIKDVKVDLLSYGQRRVIEIILALTTRPQLLLLDEPAAGLSNAETKMIINTISALDPQLSILVVDHNMDLIFSVCDRVTVIANGQVLAEGVGDEVRRNKLVIDAYLGMPL